MHLYVQTLIPVLLPVLTESIPGLLHQAVKMKERAQQVLTSSYFISKFFETGRCFKSSTKVGEGSLKPVQI